jgi:hypothetical protein
MGNRPNEGHAEMTTCLYLPDGRVAFWYGRPRIEGNAAHDAGGLRFEVVRPFEEHRVTYDGPVVVLDDPSRMEDPRRAFAENPRVDCRLDQVHRGIAKPWGGEPEPEEGEARPEDAETGFARGHLEQHMAVTGTVTVGDERVELTDGLGLRDHSWGPRYWQNVWWYRWLTVNLGPDLGFAVTVSGDEAGGRRAGGFLYDRARHGDGWVPVRGVDLASEFDDRWYHSSLRVTVHTDDHSYDVEGEVRALIPLRNRRNGMTTRITEGMTRWRCGDIEGSGLAEYLDQVVDGRPVGATAGH